MSPRAHYAIVCAFLGLAIVGFLRWDIRDVSRTDMHEPERVPLSTPPLHAGIEAKTLPRGMERDSSSPDRSRSSSNSSVKERTYVSIPRIWRTYVMADIPTKAPISWASSEEAFAAIGQDATEDGDEFLRRLSAVNYLIRQHQASQEGKSVLGYLQELATRNSFYMFRALPARALLDGGEGEGFKTAVLVALEDPNESVRSSMLNDLESYARRARTARETFPDAREGIDSRVEGIIELAEAMAAADASETVRATAQSVLKNLR